MYSNDNLGYLPFDARNVTEYPEDFIWWQADRIGQIDQSAIAPYVGLAPSNLNVMRCPSDNCDQRVRSTTTTGPTGIAFGPYYFSYVMNWLICGGDSNGASVATICIKLTDVVSSSDKILMYEEDQDTVDDGNGELWTNGGGVNLMALRHDKINFIQTDSSSSTLPIPNPNARGNVLFCDGHVEFVPRSFAQTQAHSDGGF